MAEKTFRPAMSDEADHRIIEPISKARKTTKEIRVPKKDLENLIKDNSAMLAMLDTLGVKIDQWSEEDLI